MKTMFYVLAALSLSACMDLSQAAEAKAQDMTQRHQAVYYGDLDLHRATGVAALYGRIKSAANVVCTMPNMRSLAQPARYKTCTGYAIARAVSEVGSPELTQFHEARVPQALPMSAQVSRVTAKVTE